MRQISFLLVVTYPIISFFVEELFPFSSATMFAFPLKQIHIVEVTNEQGEDLTDRFPQLNLYNDCDPPVTTLGRRGYGKKGDPTFHGQDQRAPYGTLAETKLLSDYILTTAKKTRTPLPLSMSISVWDVADDRVRKRLIETVDVKAY